MRTEDLPRRISIPCAERSAPENPAGGIPKRGYQFRPRSLIGADEKTDAVGVLGKQHRPLTGTLARTELGHPRRVRDPVCPPHTGSSSAPAHRGHDEKHANAVTSAAAASIRERAAAQPCKERER